MCEIEGNTEEKMEKKKERHTESGGSAQKESNGMEEEE